MADSGRRFIIQEMATVCAAAGMNALPGSVQPVTHVIACERGTALLRKHKLASEV